MLTHDGCREWTQEELDADAYLPQCDHEGCVHQAGYACIDCGGFFCRAHAAPGSERWNRCAECHAREQQAAQASQSDCLSCEMARVQIEVETTTRVTGGPNGGYRRWRYRITRDGIQARDRGWQE